MNIVFLDSKPLVSDGLSLDSFHKLGQVTIYEATSPEEVISRSLEANILLINKIKLASHHFAALPKLQYIGETATGVDNIDLQAAKNAGVIVTNVPAYSTDSVVQHVLALLLTHTNDVARHNASVKQGQWQKQPVFSYWLKPLIELRGLTLGLLGFGKVAKKLALVANELGMQVIAHTPNSFEHPFTQHVSLADLLAQSDVLSLHCPLTDTTRQIINRQTLQAMKPGSILINTGRGGLVNEVMLAEALQNGLISAAYLDVLAEEPPSPSNPLLNLPNCIITPHIAWASLAARKRLLNAVYENIVHFFNKQPINVVN